MSRKPSTSTPRPVPRSFPHLIIRPILEMTLMLCFLSTSAFAAGELVQVWTTKGDQSLLLASQPSLTFGADTTQGLLIEVNELNTYQTVEGFGAALTDSSAWLMANAMSTTQRADLIEALFGTSGIGLQWIRLPMGASDFALTHYSYNDMPAGQTDPTLANFSIAHDQAYIIPVLQEILAVNPDVKIIASPWSAPGWMKDTDSLIGGRLLAQHQAAYAAYFDAFVDAYAAAGIAIEAVTVQNEPQHDPGNYPGMLMDVEQQIDFVANDLGPTLAAGGSGPRIFAWDHNWNQPWYGVEVANGSGSYVDGVAFHCYQGQSDYQNLTHAARPDLTLFFTECSSGAWSPNFPNNLLWDGKTLVVGTVRNWASAVLKWNLALDENYGPHLGGCADCTGVVTIDSTTGSVTFNHDYYALGQASKFVQAGAVRIASSSLSGSNIESVAFRNPDGSKVLYVTNDTNRKQTVKLRWAGQSAQASLERKSITTFVWSGTQSENSAPDAVTGLSATADHDSVDLEWTFSHLAASYVVERSSGGAYAAVATVTEPFYQDAAVTSGTAYTYRVAAQNAAGTAAASATAAATPGPIDATARFEAEDFADQHGVGLDETSDSGGGRHLGWVDAGDWVRFPAVDFGDGVTSVDVRVATELSGTVEFRLDDPASGALIASVPVTSTGGWGTWATQSATAGSVSGVQDLYVVFQGGDGVGNINYFQFSACTSSCDGGGDPPSGGALHVGDITMSSVKQGRAYKPKADVLIVDENGQPVGSATVDGSFSGASSSSATKSTDSSGHAILDGSKVNGGGTWTFCVDDVTLSGWTYDAAANVETCDTITAP